MERQREIEDEFRELRPVALDGVLDKGMNFASEGSYEETGQRGQQSRRLKMPEREMHGDVNEETIFIDLRKTSQEYKLYALDKKNKKHIELTKFPFTIGKMAGYVDCALADDSVSRLHARIEKRENKLYLTDMNSTNGTYKNGLRMEPSETVELEPGDEIRFGKLNYCYR
ncbi:MAG: FHA domain-containing protein [Lachnospiraceae bacterium]|nr:FHA domain-containing protein [Lachnospiraceae bacterium]